MNTDLDYLHEELSDLLRDKRDLFDSLRPYTQDLLTTRIQQVIEMIAMEDN